jgi:hypothetical protein
MGCCLTTDRNNFIILMFDESKLDAQSLEFISEDMAWTASARPPDQQKVVEKKNRPYIIQTRAKRKISCIHLVPISCTAQPPGRREKPKTLYRRFVALLK